MGQLFNRTILSMAIAIFSMFFGAGNVVFPLLLGIHTQNQFGWAFFGLFLTGIIGPLLGLLGATLFQGKCVPFFTRFGRIPGGILIAITLALLGPFAVLPRCVTVAHAAIQPIFPMLSLSFFALFFGIVALFCCWRRRFLLPVLGYVLSPMLIMCLLLIVYQGVYPSPDVAHYQLSEISSISPWSAFTTGLSTGYDTMDLIAAIYFSAGIWAIIKMHLRDEPAVILRTTLKAGTLGCLFLALIYLGLTHAAARFSQLLVDIPPEHLMTHLANITLGPTLGIVANVAISLACLTTVISLTMTISEIAAKEIWPNYLSYRTAIILNLAITTLLANIGFAAIMHLIHSVVTICYPIILVLTLLNIIHKMRQGSN